MLEKLNELKELNEKFYEMFGRLFRNRKLLDNEKTVKYFGEKLFEQYKAEYEALKYKHELIELPELEKLKQRHFALVPRKYRVWYFLWLFKRRNRALKNIDREIYIELEQHFRKKEAALERLEKLLENSDSADKQTTAFDEPLEEPGEQRPTEPEKSQVNKYTACDGKEYVTPATKTGKTAAATDIAAKIEKEKKSEPTGQAPGQITLDDVQVQTEPKKP